MKKHLMVIVTGALIGIAALVLVKFGNPGNMGFCIACFLRDMAGALKLHNAAVVQYMRPEVIGLVLGAFIIAFVKREFKPRGGSAAFTRFTLGFFVMIGALMFLGCPLRQLILTGEGNTDSAVTVIGLIAGAAFAHNFALASSGKGPTGAGMIAVIIGLVVTAFVSVYYSVKNR